MKTEDVIRMALEAGANPSYNPDKWDILEISDKSLERFAALVAAHEREECAKLADKYMERWTADAIRARGEK